MKGIPATVALSFLCLASQPLRAATFAAPPPAAFGRPMTTTTTAAATEKIEQLPIITTAVVAVTSSSLDYHYHASSRRTRNFTAVKSKTSNDDGADIGGGGGDDDAPFGMRINPPYAIAYVLFLSYAYLRSSSEPDGASMEILQKFFDNPTNPAGVNELFVTVFNLLGLYAAPIACLLLPGAGRQSLPATPFVLGSMLGGYGALGIYAISRTPDPSPPPATSESDPGWFTSNVLENKIFNWSVVLACASAYVTSGAFGALVADPANLIGGYAEMMADSAIASVSSLDFAILTLTAASFVPEDLSRRGYRGDVDPAWIAASTMLLPGLGVALYCALRPSLVDEE